MLSQVNIDAMRRQRNAMVQILPLRSHLHTLHFGKNRNMIGGKHLQRGPVARSHQSAHVAAQLGPIVLRWVCTPKPDFFRWARSGLQLVRPEQFVFRRPGDDRTMQ